MATKYICNGLWHFVVMFFMPVDAVFVGGLVPQDPSLLTAEVTLFRLQCDHCRYRIGFSMDRHSLVFKLGLQDFDCWTDHHVVLDRIQTLLVSYNQDNLTTEFWDTSFVTVVKNNNIKLSKFILTRKELRVLVREM